MEKILYDLMDWAGIEELVYSEASDPGRILGEHVIKEGLELIVGTKNKHI